MTTACVETLRDTLEEMKALFAGHFEELALDKAEAPLDPQYEVYLERERRGEVMLVVVRDKGLLVGYLVAFIAPGLHYRTVLTCTTDIFYIVPEFRTGGCGKLLFAAAEKRSPQARCQTLVRREQESRGLQPALGAARLPRNRTSLLQQDPGGLGWLRRL